MNFQDLLFLRNKSSSKVFFIYLTTIDSEEKKDVQKEEIIL